MPVRNRLLRVNAAYAEMFPPSGLAGTFPPLRRLQWPGRGGLWRGRHVVRKQEGADRRGRRPDAVGRDIRRSRREFRTVFRICGARRALSVRQQGARDRARHAAGIHRRDLARLRARRRPRPTLRLSRPRPLQSGSRPSLQPAQAVDRPLRARHLRRDQMGTADLRLHVRGRGGRPLVRRDRQRAVDAEMRRRRTRRLRLAGAPPPNSLGPVDHLRNPPARLHQAAPEGARRSCAAPSRAWRHPTSSPTSRALASPRSS